MNILLTNDDGVHAPGLVAIHSELSTLGNVVVVAPQKPQSGMSHSITFTRPVTCKRLRNKTFKGYAVAGTPADCVKLACSQLNVGPIDLVVSGINQGANVGFNVCYSGTVAAAIEGVFRGIPAVALSLVQEDPMDYESAARHALSLLQRCLPLSTKAALNINIPRLSEGEPRGIRVVPQSTRGFNEYYLPQASGPALTFQISGGAHRPEEALTDTMALSCGYITVTPLHGDLTRHDQLADIELRLARTPIDSDSSTTPWQTE
ncbi:MAG: 5'/3'-nucleotidase SurE [Planctomycetes bacterium]|nr:5'/3'-nucleotidase SurE [Planctomycetota bacterium]